VGREDHAIKQESYDRAVDEVYAEEDASFNGEKNEDDVEELMDGDSAEESGNEDGGQWGEMGGSMSEYVCWKPCVRPAVVLAYAFKAVQLGCGRNGASVVLDASTGSRRSCRHPKVEY